MESLDQFDGVKLSVCSTRFDDESIRSAVSLASSPRKKVVRLTGGAGGLSAADAAGMYEVFVNAFRGCDIAILAGGTRMLLAPGYDQVLPSITEVLPKIAACSPKAKTVGIVPMLHETLIVPGLGHMISNEKSFVTIIHPELYACILLQYSADKGVEGSWDAEWQASLRYMEWLRNDAEHESLHIVYNGGQYTENELLHVARLNGYSKPWQLLIIEDSGRIATKYSKDKAFREQYPHVQFCKKRELRQKLVKLEIIAP